MDKKVVYLTVFMLFMAVLACSLPSRLLSTEEEEPAGESTSNQENQAPSEVEIQAPTTEETQSKEAAEDEVQVPEAEVEEADEEESIPVPLPPPSGAVILPENLVYQGAFRLPDEAGGSSWDYSGTALAFYPGGDPNGSEDGFPGSLFAAGSDITFEVAEINIPQPVNSRNLDDLPTAGVLQPLQDISSGTIDPGAYELPRLGLEYLSAQGDQTSGKLYFSVGHHFQEFELSHGWREVDLTDANVAGLWGFDGYCNYTSNDYIFEIPKEWADLYTPGQYLATGRAREGPWSGNGPALFAYGPWNDGNPPTEGSSLSSITPLLLYGIQEPDLPQIVTDETMSIDNRFNCDHWLGAAWLSAGENAAVIFAGTKALHRCWYGFANGVEWDYDCVETNSCPEVPEWPYDDRGFWAEEYIAQIIFFDPADLAAVVSGTLETWEPQPYATLDVTEYMFNPAISPADYKRDILGAAAFDRTNGFLYIVERLADGYKSVIHVWKVE